MNPQDFARYESDARDLWTVPSSALDLLSAAPGERRNWREFAVCAQVDPELFFPESGANYAAEARRICALCDVRTECLEWAIAHHEQGIWGGVGSRARQKMAAQRRKATVAA